MALAVIMSLICAIWVIALYRKIGQDTYVLLEVLWIFAMMGTFMAWVRALCGS